MKKAIMTLYTLIVVCMGLATIIEKLYGTPCAVGSVYGSWWFISLWGVLSLLSLIYLFQRKLHKKIAVMLLHVSFVVILAGALVTHLTSESGTIHLRKGESVSHFTNTDGQIRQLPFAMSMSSFDIINYPGTNSVMDYSCAIDVKDTDDSQQITVSMNNIGKVAGYRFYQSAYDSDGEGTQLLVAFDPYGIAITYAGYLLLLISLLWTLFSKQTRIRHLYRAATQKAVLTVAFFFCFIGANAVTQVSPDIAHEFGKVVTLYNGRLCPINTVATDFVTKLTGKPSWEGHSADEIFVGWMIYYTEWETQKLIRVKSDAVQHIIGIDSQWASVRDFYTQQNEYKLKEVLNDTTLEETVRKALRETDEKIQVVTMFYNSEMLHIFPFSSEGRLDWYTPGSTELPLGIPEAEFQFINHAMDNLVQSILVNNVDDARTMIKKIQLYQKEKAADVLPSATEVTLEVFYNSLLSARWWVFLCLTLSIVLCFLSLHSTLSTQHSALTTQHSALNTQHSALTTQHSPLCTLHSALTTLHSALSTQHYALCTLHSAFITLLTAYLTVLLAIRWWISGHAPMSNGYETMVFMAWATMMFTILVMRKIDLVKSFGPVVASFCMLVSMLAVGSPQITNLMPVLQSPLLTIHVAVVMIAYALFAMITLMAIYGVILHKKQNVNELQRVTALTQLLLYPAVALLAVGIFVGAVWANISWGTYWSWDPKETWALITLMIYAVPLHRSALTTKNSKLKTQNYFLIIAFFAVLMTYFGVNYFLPGMHSYA